LKIAFDENVPIAMVRVFNLFANEKQLRKITGKFEIKSAKDYTPQLGDPDYLHKNDVPWLKRFAADDGKVVISGNTEMKNQNHERLALIECGFIVIFFEPQWSNWKFSANALYCSIGGQRLQRKSYTLPLG
jgi:ribosomal protein S18